MRRIRGSKQRPRLAVFRSNKAIYAQIIDDQQAKTLTAADSTQVEEKKEMTKKEKAAIVGRMLAEKAVKLGIKKVVFDRRKYQYHGRVKALADGARKGGLEF